MKVEGFSRVEKEDSLHFHHMKVLSIWFISADEILVYLHACTCLFYRGLKSCEDIDIIVKKKVKCLQYKFCKNNSANIIIFSSNDKLIRGNDNCHCQYYNNGHGYNNSSVQWI